MPKLATKATSSVLVRFERKISKQVALRAGNGITLIIWNEDMDIIKILQSLQNQVY